MDLLRTALIIAVLFQPNAPRLFAASAFVGLNIFHYTYLSNMDGVLYYGVAALFDLLMIVSTAGIRPIQDMVLKLHKVAIVSILANIYGAVLWFLYLPPATYNAAFILIYSWLLITLMGKGERRVGNPKNNSWIARLASYTSSCSINSVKY